MTEWQEFRSPDFQLLKEKLGDAVIFDGRNLYEPEAVNVFGLKYYAMGRGASVSRKSGSYSRRSTDD